jgi:hypothetical protein
VHRRTTTSRRLERSQLTDDEHGCDKEHCPRASDGGGVLPVASGLWARGLDLLEGAVHSNHPRLHTATHTSQYTSPTRPGGKNNNTPAARGGRARAHVQLSARRKPPAADPRARQPAAAGAAAPTPPSSRRVMTHSAWPAAPALPRRAQRIAPAIIIHFTVEMSLRQKNYYIFYFLIFQLTLQNPLKFTDCPPKFPSRISALGHGQFSSVWTSPEPRSLLHSFSNWPRCVTFLRVPSFSSPSLSLHSAPPSGVITDLLPRGPNSHTHSPSGFVCNGAPRGVQGSPEPTPPSNDPFVVGSLVVVTLRRGYRVVTGSCGSRSQSRPRWWRWRPRGGRVVVIKWSTHYIKCPQFTAKPPECV